MLSNCNFAGDNIPDVCVDTMNLNGKEIDVVTICNSFQVPYFLKNRSKRYNFLREGYIYTRIGDKNTPISENANIQQIEILWKKRLGLILPPLEQIISRLKNKFEWIENEGTHYNMYRPEFMLVEAYDDDEYNRLDCEFYVYSQTNLNFKYKNLKIMFNQTILKEFQLVLLDSRVFKTPVPQWGYVGYDKYGVNHKYTYKYYLKDGIDYQLQQYYFDAENLEEMHAKRKFDEIIL